MTKKTKGIFKTTKKYPLRIVKVIRFLCDIHALLPLVFQNACELSLSCRELVTIETLRDLQSKCQPYAAVAKLYLAESDCSHVGPVCALTRDWMDVKFVTYTWDSETFLLFLKYPELFCVPIILIFEYFLSVLEYKL